MTKLDWRDWALMLTLGPVWATCLAGTLWLGLSYPAERFGLFLVSASPSEYPQVGEAFGRGWERGDTPIRAGDRIVSIGGTDLRGATVAYAKAVGFLARRAATIPEIVYERDGVPSRTTLPIVSEPLRWWAQALASIAMAATGFLILLRARGWHLRRRFFVGALLGATYPAAVFFSFAGGSWGLIATVSMIASGGPLQTVSLWTALEWTESAKRRLAGRRWPGFLSVALGTFTSVGMSLAHFTHMGIPRQTVAPSTTIYFLLVAWAFARTYRQSDAAERRQIRWVAWGFIVGIYGYGAGLTLFAVGSPFAFTVISVAPLAQLEHFRKRLGRSRFFRGGDGPKSVG